MKHKKFIMKVDWTDLMEFGHPDAFADAAMDYYEQKYKKKIDGTNFDYILKGCKRDILTFEVSYEANQ